MFTGLIETLGTVIEARSSGNSIALTIRPEKKDFSASIGASIAIDGVCLTVEKIRGDLLVFTAVQETLSRSTLARIQTGRRVNLEKALQFGGRLDGHLVQGHVDGIGTITGDRQVGVSTLRTIRLPESLRPFMAEKGSVAVDGASLTIASCTETEITLSLIPHTLKETTMHLKRAGDEVNLECDVVARYLYRLVTSGAIRNSDVSLQKENDSLLSRMERLGF